MSVLPTPGPVRTGVDGGYRRPAKGAGPRLRNGGPAGPRRDAGSGRRLCRARVTSSWLPAQRVGPAADGDPCEVAWKFRLPELGEEHIPDLTTAVSDHGKELSVAKAAEPLLRLARSDGDEDVLDAGRRLVPGNDRAGG